MKGGKSLVQVGRVAGNERGVTWNSDFAEVMFPMTRPRHTRRRISGVHDLKVLECIMQTTDEVAVQQCTLSSCASSPWTFEEHRSERNLASHGASAIPIAEKRTCFLPLGSSTVPDFVIHYLIHLVARDPLTTILRVAAGIAVGRQGSGCDDGSTSQMLAIVLWL
jgi:hypothetical protein